MDYHKLNQVATPIAATAPDVIPLFKQINIFLDTWYAATDLANVYFLFLFLLFFFLITISKEHQKQLIWQGQQYTFYFLASQVFQFCSPMSYFSPQTLVTFPTHKTVSHWSTALMTC